MTYVFEALQLEDTIRNYERRSSTGWFSSNHVFFCLFYFSDILVAFPQLLMFMYDAISGNMYLVSDLVALGRQEHS